MADSTSHIDEDEVVSSTNMTQFDDDIDEDDFDLIQNIGEDPLMEPVQNALFKQLTSINERLSMEIRDAQEDDKRIKAKREQIGVTLYGVQQQLAKLQLSVEDVNARSSVVASERKMVEEDITSVATVLQDMKTEITDEERKLESNKKELEALNQTLRQVEVYNEEMKSEIAVIRRATYKAEENVLDLEKKKQEQDLYVDSLNEQVKQLHEQIALYDAQIASQGQETAAAKDTLHDASKEMHTIEFEKKQLIQQWKSSLVGLQRRDEALQATREAIQEQREKQVVLRTEIEGLKRSSNGYQVRNEQALELKMRLEHGTKQVDDQIKTLVSESEKIHERMGLLRKTIEQAEGEMHGITSVENTLNKEFRGIANNAQVIDRERQVLEEEISRKKSEQTTSSKAVKNLVRDALKIQESIHALEIEQANKENELARVKVDCLNTKAFDEQLEKTLQGLLEELKEKDKLIEKYQLEIRQRNDEVEKKMYIVDRLNRKYEALTANQEEENLGPLEATIKNIQKQTQSLNRQNRDIERQWLKFQTELVAVVNEVERVSSIVHELRSREAILGQKGLRIDSQIRENQLEVDKLKTEISKMHTDIAKLNELLSKNKKVQEELANTNYVLESEFVEELKVLEQDSIKVDQNILKSKQEKEDAMEEIIQIEEQLMLWEKKIELEKETQAALDPHVGQSEVRSMHKEIHRMRVRQESLIREREKLLKEMELAIYKHDSITVRHKGKKSGGEKVSKVQLQKQYANAKRQLRELHGESKQYDEFTKTRLDDSENIGMEMEKLNNKYRALEEQANDMQKTINTNLFEKQKKLNAINKQQRLLQRYKDCPTMDDTAAMEADLKAAQLPEVQAKVSSINMVLDHLQVEYPHLEEVLSRVSHLLDM